MSVNDEMTRTAVAAAARHVWRWTSPGGHGSFVERNRNDAAKNGANSMTSEARNTTTPNVPTLRTGTEGSDPPN